MRSPALARLLERVRRLSAWVRAALTLALLAVVYWVVLGPFALGFRLMVRTPRPMLRTRQDPDLGTLPRLGAPF